MENLQALLDAAPAGGVVTLDPAKAYGPAKFSKRLTINGNGAVLSGSGNVLELAPGADGSVVRDVAARGSTALNAALFLVRAPHVALERVTATDGTQYGIRAYHTTDLTVAGAVIRRVACGVEINGFGNGVLLNDLDIAQIDRMMLDTVSGWGGDGINFFRTDPAAVMRVSRLSVRGSRAKTALAPWPWDGSAIEAYGSSGKVIVDGFVISDCVNFVEVGTDDPTQVATGWELRNGTVTGNPVTSPGWDRNCQGMYLRANKNFLVEGVVFSDVDDFALAVVAGGTYGGAQSGNILRNCTIRLKAGPSITGYGVTRAYVVASGADPRVWDVYGNTVVCAVGFDAGLVATKTARTPTEMQALAGWSMTGEKWGPAALPAPDPCDARVAAVQAVLDAERAASAALAATLTAERDAARAQADARLGVIQDAIARLSQGNK